jgi:homocysteine S-methyltransferase
VGIEISWSPFGLRGRKTDLKVAAGNPLLPFLETQKVLILDGGLATTLEERGFDLDDELWSAKILLEEPEAIGQVHRDFLAAGADCITTATYQATLPGLQKRGLGADQARMLMDRAVNLAVAARDEFWSEEAARRGRRRPLVAASVGPYGAYLADGSEYTGNYGLSQEELRRFHCERWAVLAAGPADLLACETLPSLTEAQALLDLLQQTPTRWVWFSFSCRDGSTLCDGTPFSQAVELCAASPRVAAVGVNCSAPEFISPLLDIGRRATRKPLIVYPNSGETYAASRHSWTSKPDLRPLPGMVAAWYAQGARAIGGCCRVGPPVIQKIRAHLLD